MNTAKNIYGFIYKITNTKNNKIYVGQHMGADFGEYWGSGVLLNRAYEKYGRDSFKREIIQFASFKEELNFLERYYIQKLNSLVPHGYNIATGGHGGYTGEVSEESREKIRQALKGKPKSKEQRRRLSEAKKGIPTHKQTEETKKKISEAHMGIEPWNKGKGKQISQYTIDGEFIRAWDSLTEASKNGFSMSKISQCLNGTRKHHRHFLWRFNNGTTFTL